MAYKEHFCRKLDNRNITALLALRNDRVSSKCTLNQHLNKNNALWPIGQNIEDSKMLLNTYYSVFYDLCTCELCTYNKHKRQKNGIIEIRQIWNHPNCSLKLRTHFQLLACPNLNWTLSARNPMKLAFLSRTLECRIF